MSDFLEKLLEQVGQITGYYVTTPPTPDYEFVNVCNGDLRKLSEAYAQYAVSQTGTLDERMAAAGMVPLSDLLSNETPVDKYMAHVGVSDINSFEQWLMRRHNELQKMRIPYALGDKDENDELYEWILGNSGAFSEVVANFRQMKERSHTVCVEAILSDPDRVAELAEIVAEELGDDLKTLLNTDFMDYISAVKSLLHRLAK